MTFSDVVEEIKSLSIEEKLEIQLLLQQYLRATSQKVRVDKIKGKLGVQRGRR